MSSSLFLIAVLLQPAAAPTSQPAAAPTSQPASKPTTQPAKPKAAETGWKSIRRGAAFTLSESMTMDTLVASASQYAGKNVLVKGTITTVCRKKGCWMILGGKAATARARVTFKNYAFFVPLDASGATASVEGVVEVKVLGEAERKHLADDAGKSLSEMPKHELRLMASGVALTR